MFTGRISRYPRDDGFRSRRHTSSTSPRTFGARGRASRFIQEDLAAKAGFEPRFVQRVERAKLDLRMSTFLASRTHWRLRRQLFYGVRSSNQPGREGLLSTGLQVSGSARPETPGGTGGAEGLPGSQR